ncbi:MAG: hypothetical protein ACI88C_000088 [Acidimicrobiales bacterium]|jgi:hypothetical protein
MIYIDKPINAVGFIFLGMAVFCTALFLYALAYGDAEAVLFFWGIIGNLLCFSCVRFMAIVAELMKAKIDDLTL